ncbi:MAG: hypothetical protein K2X27_08555 [Candidatus Obscuribacterales bacterium]|nr:hypothetical protein [Candidatus Obscuribacterales bacterium]
MKSTGEILISKLRFEAEGKKVDSLNNLRKSEKDAVKDALKELGRMLAEISYKKLD